MLLLGAFLVGLDVLDLLDESVSLLTGNFVHRRGFMLVCINQ